MGICDFKPVTGLIFDGAVQIAAATLLTVAFAAPRRWAIRQSAVSSILMSPVVSPGAYGVTLRASL